VDGIVQLAPPANHNGRLRRTFASSNFGEVRRTKIKVIAALARIRHGSDHLTREAEKVGADGSPR